MSEPLKERYNESGVPIDESEMDADERYVTEREEAIEREANAEPVPPVDLEALADEQESDKPKEDPKAPGTGYIDTTERKESYTSDEYARVIRQRDAILHQSQEQAARLAQIDDRLAQVNEALAARSQPEPPDPSEDPVGHLSQQIQTRNQQFDALLEREQQRLYEQQQAAASQQFVQAAEMAQRDHLQRTGQTAEEFEEKLVAVRSELAEFHAQQGLGPQDIRRVIGHWEKGVIEQAFRRGENPAEIFERLYAERFDASSGEPQTPAAPRVSPQDTVERAQRGRKAQSLTGGRPSSGRSVVVTQEMLAAMPKEQFDEVIGKIKGTEKEDELDMRGRTTVPL